MTLQAPPNYAVGIDDSVHNMPAQSSSSPLDLFGQIAASVRFAVESFIGQVAIAFGGINIFGWRPFDFLAQWGQDRIAEASANYNAAIGAQASANTANAGVAILNARVNGLSGGVSYYDTFDRDTPPSTPAVDALGADYTIMYGSGSGTIETSVANNGTTIWNVAGFGERIVWIRRETALVTTNNQRMSVVFNNFVNPSTGDKPHVYLMGRWDHAATMALSNFVMARIGDNSCEIGYVINGTYARFGSAVTIECSDGDLWDFEVGTAGDEWQFRLLQNNALRVDRTDLGHVSMKDTTPGTLYQYSGFGEDAGVHSNFPGHLAQVAPPKIQVLAGGNTA